MNNEEAVDVKPFDFDELITRAGDLQRRLDGRVDDSTAGDSKREENNDVLEVVTNVTAVSATIADQVVHVAKVLQASVENSQGEWVAPAVKTCEVLTNAPYAGMVFALLVPVLEALNESAKVESHTIYLLQRIKRFISYLSEIVTQAKSGFGDVNKNLEPVERSFAWFMTIIDEDITQLVVIDKERAGKWKRLKRPWRASRHVQQLEGMNRKIDEAFIERATVESIKALPALHRIETLLQEVHGDKMTFRDEKPPNSIVLDCPKLFGRNAELDHLQEALDSGGSMASLVGSAGMGKTHCAKFYARTWWKEKLSNRFVFWLSAANERTMRLDYLKVLERLRSSVKEEVHNVSTAELATLVWKRLGQVSQDHEWLIVFDDAPAPDTLKTMFLPTSEGSWGRGRILFTTRFRTYRGKTCLGHLTQISMDRLDDEAALTVFRAALDSREEAVESKISMLNLVSVQLGGLPLAIETAASEIVSRGISVEEYVKDLNLSAVFDTVHTVLRSSLIHARNELGLNATLDVAAFVNPDSIQIELLNSDSDAIGRLCNLSLLVRVKKGVFSIHRLHQEIARRGRSSKCAISAVTRILDGFELQDPASYPLALSMVPHVESLVSTCVESSEHQSEPSGDFAAIACLLFQSGNVLYQVACDYYSALSNYQMALNLYGNVLDPEPYFVAEVRYQIGMVCEAVGDDRDSIASFETGLEVLRDPAMPDTKAVKALTASTLYRLGILYTRLCDFEGAASRFAESLSTHRLVLGDVNEDVADALHYMGKACWNMGNNKEALKCYMESLAMKKKIFGDRESGIHSIAWTLHEMGCLCFALGDYEGAREKFSDAYEREKKALGSRSHSYIAAIENWRGKVSLALGDYSDAMDYFEKAGSIDMSLLGPGGKKVSIGIRLSSMASALQGLGDLSGALEKCTAALEMFYRCFNDRDARNDKIAISLCIFASILIDMGDFDKAAPRLTDSLAMLRETFPSGKHERIAQVHYEFGRLYEQQGDLLSARTAFNEAFTMLSDILEENAQRTDLGKRIRSELISLDVRDRHRRYCVCAFLIAALSMLLAAAATSKYS